LVFGRFDNDKNFKAYAVRYGLKKTLNNLEDMIKFNKLFEKHDLSNLSEMDYDILELEIGILFNE
jgi:hypothetical protein